MQSQSVLPVGVANPRVSMHFHCSSFVSVRSSCVRGEQHHHHHLSACASHPIFRIRTGTYHHHRTNRWSPLQKYEHNNIIITYYCTATYCTGTRYGTLVRTEYARRALIVMQSSIIDRRSSKSLQSCSHRYAWATSVCYRYRCELWWQVPTLFGQNLLVRNHLCIPFSVVVVIYNSSHSSSRGNATTAQRRLLTENKRDSFSQAVINHTRAAPKFSDHRQPNHTTAPIDMRFATKIKTSLFRIH